MILNNTNNRILKIIINYLLLSPFNAFAQRVSNEDLHGNILSGGSNFFAVIIILVVILFIIKTMATNKGFRSGIFLYGGVLLSIILIGKTFEKEITILYLLGLAVFFFFYDKKITGEESKQSGNKTIRQRNNNSEKDSSASKNSIKVCLKTVPKNNEKSIQCKKCRSFQIINDSSRMIECTLCKHKWLYEK